METEEQNKWKVEQFEMTEKGLQWDNTVAVYCRGLDYGLRG